MNDSAGIVSFANPAGYDSIIVYANTAKKNFEAIRNAKPADINAIKKALDDFIENCKFKNCVGNDGYIKALGFGEK